MLASKMVIWLRAESEQAVEGTPCHFRKPKYGWLVVNRQGRVSAPTWWHFTFCVSSGEWLCKMQIYRQRWMCMIHYHPPLFITFCSHPHPNMSLYLLLYQEHGTKQDCNTLSQNSWHHGALGPVGSPLLASSSQWNGVPVMCCCVASHSKNLEAWNKILVFLLVYGFIGFSWAVLAWGFSRGEQSDGG